MKEEYRAITLGQVHDKYKGTIHTQEQLDEFKKITQDRLNKAYEDAQKRITLEQETKDIEDGEKEVSGEPVLPQLYCTREKLGLIFSEASEATLNEFYDLFYEYARHARIDMEVQENFFLTQIYCEVGSGLASSRENLNYACDALVDIFSYYSNSPAEAEADGRCYGHDANKQSIGNKAYANRLGNGNVVSGDGYKFRGGGYFQLTGRYNYQTTVDWINNAEEENYTADYYASIITDTDAGLFGAMAFWYDNEMYLCKTIDECTAIINYHTDSYEKRHDVYMAIAEL